MLKDVTNNSRIVLTAFALTAILQVWMVSSSDYLDSDDWFVVEMGRMVSEAPSVSHFTRFWSNEPTWRPVLTLRSAIEYSIFADHPLSRVVVNVVLHTVCAWLLMLCVARLLNDRAVGVATAFLFLIHPLHAESLAWFHSGFEGITITVFILLTLWLFIQERAPWIVLAAFQAALLTRENALCVPLLIMLIAWLQSSDISRRLHHCFRVSLPYWGLLFANLIVRIALLKSQEHEYSSLHLVEDPLIAVFTAMAHPWLPIHPALSGRIAWLLAFVALALCLLLLQRKRSYGVMGGAFLAFLLCSLPFIPHFHVAHRFIEALPGGHEQRWYFFHLPLAALMIWPAWLFVHWAREHAFAKVAFGLLVILFMTAQFQNMSWWMDRSETATQVGQKLSETLDEQTPIGLFLSEGSDDANIADQVFLNYKRRYPHSPVRVFHVVENARDGHNGPAEAQKPATGHWHWVAGRTAPAMTRWWRWHDSTRILESEAPKTGSGPL
ncbi:MAG TPA: hypothetical protein EYN66_24000 [Myxococcales bacterium]|nr:hypothetical protein [Myxococcales bacterium]